MEEKLKDLENDLKSLSKKELEQKYLSKSGIVTELFKGMGNIPSEERAEYGKKLNEIKNRISNVSDIEKQESQLTTKIDPTAPFDTNTNKKPHTLDLRGSKHVLMKEVEDLMDIFVSMGFKIYESRQVDDDFHMFESLNFPKGHPARDMYDTFWTDDDFVLPAHTSTMQNRILRNESLPIRAVIPGNTYRNEATDAGHEHSFYQCEGIYVDKNVSISNMIATIKEYLEKYFETKLEVKIQPAYFPFTEPDCEFTISCPFCNKTGCSTCGHTGWIELMGCGMIHPNVLKAGGIDPEEYSGFAWGFGVDRFAMLKNKISDVRNLRSGNIKFLREY